MKDATRACSNGDDILKASNPQDFLECFTADVMEDDAELEEDDFGTSK